MKKMLTLAVCLLLAVSLLAGCGKKPADSSTPNTPSTPDTSSVTDTSSTPDDTSTPDASGTDSASTDSGADSTPAAGEINMADVVAALEAVAPVAMAQELSPSIEGSADYMTDLFGLNLDDIEDYYGKTTIANVSSDVVLMVKAKPGQVDTVKAALEQHRSNLAASFEMYLEDQFIKASNGRVVTKGDYVLLVVLGDNDRITNGEVDAVYQELDEVIDTALA